MRGDEGRWKEEYSIYVGLFEEPSQARILSSR